MISELGSASQPQGNHKGEAGQPRQRARTRHKLERRPGTSQVRGESVPVALAVHLDVGLQHGGGGKPRRGTESHESRVVGQGGDV
jgi:hypothetical protein